MSWELEIYRLLITNYQLPLLKSCSWREVGGEIVDGVGFRPIKLLNPKGKIFFPQTSGGNPQDRTFRNYQFSIFSITSCCVLTKCLRSISPSDMVFGGYNCVSA